MTIMISPSTTIRTCLFVPGDRADRFDKAWASDADDVVLDLEDAVAADHKGIARNAVSKWLAKDRPVLVRINAADTPWYRDDIELLKHPGVRGFMVPKAEQLDEELVASCIEYGKLLVPLVETAVGFKNAASLAGSRAVERLAFGTIDFQVDLGIEGEDDALAHFRSQLVLESRLAQIQPPLDGVTVDIKDPEVLRQDTLRAKRFGFGGKLCIHPRQVEVVNSVFSPTDAERVWARQVLDAVARTDGAAAAVAGKMVDKPVLAKAMRVLQADAGRISRRR
jgi:citrate lyase subunit beta/citryl-CoA lyase